MSSQPPIKDCQCDVCFKFFPKGSALIRHSLDLGHGSHRYCKPCKRQFTTVGAFKDHQQLAKAHQQQQPSGPSIPSAVSTGPSNARSGPVRDAIGTNAPSPLSHKGIRYTSLPKSDHARILKLLGNQVHPVSILKNHGYKFDTNATGPPNVCHACGTAAIFGDHGDRFSPLPKARAGSGARKAISIDCEMARLENGTNGVISMAVVDFLTGEKIITSLVQPHEPVDNWKTKLHGISPALIASERAKNAILDGWQAARAELFKHVDEDTILIGQSLNHDLKPLRIQHDKIVDSVVMASEAVHGRGSKPNYWGLGLRILCEELPKIKIRQGLLGKNGEEHHEHDGLEDALATRELVLWILKNPTAFAKWSDGKNMAYQYRQEDTEYFRKSKRSPEATRAAEQTDRERRAIPWNPSMPIVVGPIIACRSDGTYY